MQQAVRLGGRRKRIEKHISHILVDVLKREGAETIAAILDKPHSMCLTGFVS